MFSRLKYIIVSISTVFSLQTAEAQARPGVVEALTTPEMALNMSERSLEDQTQIACMALAVFHEALNQGERGQRAVLHVIQNRVKDPRFPNTPCEVVFQRRQFSFMPYPMARLIPRSTNVHWHKIVTLVKSEVDSDCRNDPTNGSQFFYNPKLARPGWRNAKASTTIGAHIFVRT